MTNEERDKLLVNIASTLSILAGRELGLKATTPASNDLLRSNVEKLDAFCLAERTRSPIAVVPRLEG